MSRHWGIPKRGGFIQPEHKRERLEVDCGGWLVVAMVAFLFFVSCVS